MSVRPASIRQSLKSQSGFALLITITLLAFLVLLLVSLASLTRVETQVASNSQQLSQARQNALMALNIALGQLQKYAGPDQRTTALADMDATLAATSAKSGRWLGVYGSGVAANYADTPVTIASKIATDAPLGLANGSQARLVNWLVSGNEGTAFDPSAAVAADGHITAPPTVFQFTPKGAVAGLGAASTALSTNITIADKDNVAQPARLLIGPGTVGTDAANASVASYVAAPLKDISAVVPGLGGSAVPIGRYAWWVGDEGAKARINLPMATAAQAGNAFVSSQRAAVELVDAIHPVGATTLLASDMLDPTGVLSRYNPGAANLPGILSTGQLPLLSASAAAALKQAVQYRYHDLTAYSSSVLADTYAGGLKKDLSALLASGASSPASSDFLFQPEADVSPYAAGSSSAWVPTWGQLRSFAGTTLGSDGKLPLNRQPNDTQVGINPVMTSVGVGFQYISAGGPGDPIYLAVFPVAVLWNPYSAPLKGQQYEMGVTRMYSSTLQLQAYNDPAVPSPKTSRWTVKETRDFNKGGVSIPTPAPGTPGTHADGSADISSAYFPYPGPTGSTYLRFVIDASNVELGPGQSMIFTLPSGGQTYSAPDNGQPTNVLKPGLRVANQAYALMPSVSSIGPGETLFRVGIYSKYPSDANYATDRTLFSPATQDTHFSGGESAYYLGPVSSTAAFGYGPDPSRSWYQSFTHVYPGTAGGPQAVPASHPTEHYSQVLQGGLSGLPLSNIAPQPEFTILMKTVFSANGSPRWIAQANLRSQVTTRNQLDQSTSGLSAVTAGPWPGCNVDPSGRVSSGIGLDSATAITDTALFEFRPASAPLLSLGQLQHANLSLLQTYPSYPLGNSLADYRFRGAAGDSLGKVVRTDGSPIGGSPVVMGNIKYTIPTVYAFYDLSYLLNRAMWDRYFVSTVPHLGTGTSADDESTSIPSSLPNPRHVRQAGATDADLRDAGKAAANLLLSGGFNINSTSEQAWRAVLGGINQLPYDPVNSNAGPALKSALPRFAKPSVAADANSAAWQGYRFLTEVQIAQLANKIVAEVRNRGPFVSMGDFVNRRLVDNPATTSAVLNADERLKGPIQNAIDATGTLTTVSGSFYAMTGTSAVNVGTTNALPVTTTAPFTVNQMYAFSGGNYTDANLMYGGPAKVAPYGSFAAFAPQFLTQADVLSAIGAGLSARSDTFVIRTYGETVNPSDATNITGRAWCEAVVQRLPGYVDPTSDPNAYSAPTAAINKTMGRRFKIISFRWLTPNDI